ncbi:MAG: response regulator transcription factor, partial [bacterium]
SSGELLARVEAVLRRCAPGGSSGEKLSSGALVMELDKATVKIGGRRINLLPKEFALLAMFLERKEHVFSYSAITDGVWGAGRITTKDTIKVTLHRLKAKLESYGSKIHPVTGVGYKWTEE